jgi:hypothetical protein
MDMRLPRGIHSALAEQQPPLRLLQRWQPQPAAPVAAIAPATTTWRTRLQRLLGR